MAKYKEPMGVKKAAKEAKKKASDIRSSGTPRESTKRLVRQNIQGGKLSFGDKMFGVYGQSKTEKKASNIVQSRREGERSRTASRAKGIASRQKKIAQTRRKKKALGN
jgi:hypothetical protein